MSISETSRLSVIQLCAMSNMQLEDFSFEQVDSFVTRANKHAVGTILYRRHLNSCPLLKAVSFNDVSPQYPRMTYCLPEVGEGEREFRERMYHGTKEVGIKQWVSKFEEGGSHDEFKYKFGEIVLVGRSDGTRTYGIVVSNGEGKHTLEWSREQIRQWFLSETCLGTQFLVDLPPHLLDVRVIESDFCGTKFPSLCVVEFIEHMRRLREPKALFTEKLKLEVKQLELESDRKRKHSCIEEKWGKCQLPVIPQRQGGC